MLKCNTEQKLSHPTHSHSTKMFQGQNLQHLVLLGRSQHYAKCHWHFKRNVARSSLIFQGSVSGNRKLARKAELMGKELPDSFFLLSFIKRIIVR